MKLIFAKRTSFYVKFIFAIILAVGLVVLDRKYDSFIKVRYYLDSAISPLYNFINKPIFLLDSGSDMLTSKRELLLRNKALQKELVVKKGELLLLEQLKHENNRLRELLRSPLRKDDMKVVTEVLSTESGPYHDQVFVDKGKNEGVYIGQPVLDEKGVIGQVYAVAKNTSRVILLCDSQHGLPVQVLRNDLRAVAMGKGCDNPLTLNFLPNDNSDIIVGDLLVTSGLDGKFPSGYPVARITYVNKDTQSGKTLVQAIPTAGLERLRYLLLVWMEKPSYKNDDFLGDFIQNQEEIQGQLKDFD